MLRFSVDYQESGEKDKAGSFISEASERRSLVRNSSSQAASQFRLTVPINHHLFGYLSPCSDGAQGLVRIDLWKINPEYQIGRCAESNMVVLPGYKVSQTHCKIMWNGKDEDSRVTVCDLSSNGTWVNGVKIGKGNTSALQDGDQICFGTTIPQPQNSGLEDYRYIYHHVPVMSILKYYCVAETLGQGSFGIVKKIIHCNTKLPFAMKTVSIENCVNEIAIMEKLDHPSICKFIEHFYNDSGKTIDLVMEYVDGGSLFEHIFRLGTGHPLSEDSARDITEQICDGMGYIHSQGITHRDLKTENILITSSTPPRVKIADFGLSKAGVASSLMTTFCGTLLCCAPEILNQRYGGEGYTNLVDSWNVGVVVYEMLTGQFLYPKDHDDGDRKLGYRQVLCLEESGTSYQARDFIFKFLVEDPRFRVAIKDAIRHPWILGYRDQMPDADESKEMADDDHSSGSQYRKNGVWGIRLAPVLEEVDSEEYEEEEVNRFDQNRMDKMGISTPFRPIRAGNKKGEARDSLEFMHMSEGHEVGPCRSSRQSKEARVRASPFHSISRGKVHHK